MTKTTQQTNSTNFADLSDLTLRRMARVPDYLLKHESKNFQGSEILKLREDAAKALKDGKGLFLYGNTGAGKSVIASDLIPYWIKLKGLKDIGGVPSIKHRGDFPLFLETEGDDGYLAKLRQSYNNNDKLTETIIVNKARQASLLVIDDLLESNVTEWGAGKLGDLIKIRHKDMMPTIITTNKNIKEVSEITHKRIASRICEMCEIVDFTKIEDHRIKTAEG
jgi:DNA replication protein DnaC